MKIRLQDRAAEMPGVCRLGVQNDHHVERVEFELPRQYGEVDLSQAVFYLAYCTPSRNAGLICLDKTVLEDAVTVVWEVGREVTQEPGPLRVQLAASGLDSRLWHSAVMLFEVAESILAESPQAILFQSGAQPAETAAELPILVAERRFLIPERLQNIAVQNDESAETVTIRLPRWYDGQDLSQYTILLKTVSVGGGDDILFTDPEVLEDAIRLRWTLGPPQTSYAGRLELQLCIFGEGFCWQSEPAAVNILRALQAEPVIPTTPTFLEEMYREMAALADAAKADSETAQEIADSLTEQSELIAEIPQKAPILSPDFIGNITTSGSTAFGSNVEASGSFSHARGYQSKATGMFSHASGRTAQATAMAAHAEGEATTASGIGSHAEGSGAKAIGTASHAEGAYTTADNYASHAQGKYNKAMATGGASTNTVGDAMVIGNGSSANDLSNAFRVTFAGETYGLSAFNASGADYAEFFEWADGNPDAEDRIGHFVTPVGKNIRKAAPGDYILGIVSGNPCIIGNSDEDWLGRWEKDAFGRFVREKVETPVTEPREVEVPVLDEAGEPTGEVTTEWQEVETGEVVVGWRYKQNPAYDAAQPYIERKDRREWDCVGMLGVLAVRDDGSCEAGGFCRVAEGGRATAADGYIPGQTYRVLERVADGIVKVIFR